MKPKSLTLYCCEEDLRVGRSSTGWLGTSERPEIDGNAIVAWGIDNEHAIYIVYSPPLSPISVFWEVRRFQLNDSNADSIDLISLLWGAHSRLGHNRRASGVQGSVVGLGARAITL